jgi:hypothetical protein
MNKRTIQMLSFLLIGFLLLAMPAAVTAQAPEPPPEWDGESEVSDDDILVIEPQFFFELPLAQGLEISFNFGISIRIPRVLTLVTEDAYTFFLRLRSYVIPAGEEAAAP